MPRDAAELAGARIVDHAAQHLALDDLGRRDAGAPSGQSLDQHGQPRSIDNPAIQNPPGSDGTDIGAVEVDHILRMIGVTRVATNVQVGFTTVSDKTYGLEYNPDLTTSSWTTLPSAIAGTGGIVTEPVLPGLPTFALITGG